MITTLFFDFDGVLTTDFNTSETVCKNLGEVLSDLSVEQAIACYRQHCGRLLLGGTYAEIWDDFCSCIGRTISRETLTQALRKVPRNEEMFKLAASLRDRYRLGIITDNPQERFDLVQNDLQLADTFDPIIVSASVHALKHDGSRTIFDAALQGAGCKPDEAFFIDNQQRNLVTPGQMGMKTYWHDDKKNDLDALYAALRETGVEWKRWGMFESRSGGPAS